MDDINIQNQVINFLEKRYAVEISRINALNIQLEKNLNIYGDDAVLLIMEFQKEFEVDISNFKLQDYFSGEGFSLSEFFFPNKKQKKKELTIGHLIESIKSGKLE